MSSHFIAGGLFLPLAFAEVTPASPGGRTGGAAFLPTGRRRPHGSGEVELCSEGNEFHLLAWYGASRRAAISGGALILLNRARSSRLPLPPTQAASIKGAYRAVPNHDSDNLSVIFTETVGQAATQGALDTPGGSDLDISVTRFETIFLNGKNRNIPGLGKIEEFNGTNSTADIASVDSF